MKAIYIQDGEAIDYTPVSAVSAGDVVVLGTLPLVAFRDISANALGALATEGAFDIVKDTSTFSAGDSFYWNATGNPVSGTAGTGAGSSTASGANLMGVVVRDALTGDSTVRVKLTAAKRTATLAGSLGADDITGTDSTLTVTGLAGTGTGAGGTVPIAGGASGNGATGNGGAVSLTGGAAISTNGTGGATSVIGGVATGTGTGGAATVRSGASAGGTGTAGTVTVDAGAANGGTAGTVSIGATNASSVTIGAASVPLITPGPQTRVAGGSTAAAGTTTADAGVLPAGTSSVYPTTAADDTKGVRVHASDKVTGRTIFIGNGVSNKILKVYAPSGGTINGAAGDAAFSSVSGKGVVIHCLDSAGNTWLAW